MLECKNYRHAEYLLGFNKIYIEHYNYNRDKLKAAYYLDRVKETGKHSGVLNVINGVGLKEEINYYGITKFKVIEKGKLEVRKTQKELAYENKEMLKNNIGKNKYINLTMEEVKKILNKGVFEIDFIKVNGSERCIVGALNDWRIADNPEEYFSGEDKDKEKYGNIVIYDLDDHAYKTVRYLSIMGLNKVVKK